MDELPIGAARGFDPYGEGEDSILVVRTSSASVCAFINRCPHAGARLEYRKDKFLSADGMHVMCHAHGALFDRATGSCVYGPCLGRSLKEIRCWIEQGSLWIADFRR